MKKFNKNYLINTIGPDNLLNKVAIKSNKIINNNNMIKFIINNYNNKINKHHNHNTRMNLKQTKNMFKNMKVITIRLINKIKVR